MRYASFVIRLWQPETTDPPPSNLRGRVEHVQGGTVVRVTDLDDVTAFIQECLSNMLPHGEEKQEDNQEYRRIS